MVNSRAKVGGRTGDPIVRASAARALNVFHRFVCALGLT